MYRCFKISGDDNDEISSWESKGLSNENIYSIITSNYSFTLRLKYLNARMRAESFKAR